MTFFVFSWLVNVHQLGKKKKKKPAPTSFLSPLIICANLYFMGSLISHIVFSFDLEPLGSHFLFMRPQLQFETLFGFKRLKCVAAHLGRSRRARVELEDHN